MQIIIEVKNSSVFNRLIDLLKKSDFIGGLRIVKKTSPSSEEELVTDFDIAPPPKEAKLDYSKYWGIIKPQLGVDTIDQMINEMREE